MEKIIKFLDSFNTIVAFPANIVIVIGLIIAIFMSMVLVFKYYLPLKKLLAIFGQGFINRINVLFHCFSLRKTAVNFRYYLELAILRSKGVIQNRDFWRDVLKEFKNRFDFI